MDRKAKKRKQLKEDLEFYLDYYKEVSRRSEKIKKEFDYQIDTIIEELKKTGK